MSDTTDHDQTTAIVHKEFDPDEADPATAVAEVVAELEGREPTDLATMYGCIDHVLDHVFSNPPAPDAQVQVSFTYERYRITVDQGGSARFIKVGEAG